MPFMGTTVRDAITLSTNYIPLPYHHETWTVTKLVPYFVDQCYTDGQPCQFYDYQNFCFKNQNFVLSYTGSQDDLKLAWTQMVTDELGVDQDTLLAELDRSTELHNSEMRTRAFWKQATARGVNGTPTYTVNGVTLSNSPSTPYQWYNLLLAVQDTQVYNPSTAKLKKEVTQ
mmetsp:Transcript_17985/g.17175  ORF Transcript_17985/g.17175 Transcript_17985/m.17175 type:complete len:172 (+) Transcript_17985:219-734(+)